MNPRYVNGAGDLDRVIAVTRQHAPHRATLFVAVRQRLISLAEIQRGTPLPVAALERTTRPAVVLVGDDDGCDCGPSGWMARPRLAGWARYAVIHGTGADVASYIAAVGIAIERRRVVLVETGTQHGMDWHRLFAKAGVPTLNFVTRAGQVHPVPVRKGDLH